MSLPFNPARRILLSLRRMKARPKIAIIGPGKVGTAIGVLAARAGWAVAAVGGRDRARAAAAAKAIGRPAAACGLPEAAAAGELVILAVSDDAIAAVCRELADASAFRAGAVVAHCSGALGSDELAAARASGYHVGSMHPLQTFPSVQAAIDRLGGAYCFIEGDEVAAAVLRRLASDIGARPVAITSAAKPLYHAAAVVACNYLAALLDAAMAICGQAGIDDQTSRRALEPLVRATVDNIMAEGTEKALTGPIARGDTETLRRHLTALAGHEDLDRLYRQLGRWTVGLALRKGTIDNQKASALRRLLDSPAPKE